MADLDDDDDTDDDLDDDDDPEGDPEPEPEAAPEEPELPANYVSLTEPEITRLRGFVAKGLTGAIARRLGVPHRAVFVAAGGLPVAPEVVQALRGWFAVIGARKG